MADTELEIKKALVTEKLLKREDDRLQQLQQKKATRDSAVDETVAYFNDNFFKTCSNVEDKLKSVEGGEEVFGEFLQQVQELQKSLNDSGHLLSAYQTQKCQTAINQLKQSIQDKRQQNRPKKKFAFKSDKKKTTAATTVTPNVEDSECVKDNTGNRVKSREQQQQPECGFSNRSHDQLVLDEAAVNSHDILLSGLDDCRIVLRGSPSTVHLSEISGCTILSGPTSGSVFVDQCSDSTLVLACHQLRVHRTERSHIYLHVTSRAIIEDCHDLQFAPFSWSYATLAEDFSRAGLDMARNNWNCIDDFNWLASTSPSPNWSILDEKERKQLDENGNVISKS